jgi:hypothetical protein
MHAGTNPDRESLSNGQATNNSFFLFIIAAEATLIPLALRRVAAAEARCEPNVRELTYPGESEAYREAAILTTLDGSMSPREPNAARTVSAI